MSYWAIELLSFWVIELLSYWVIELFGYWVIELKSYWVIELLFGPIISHILPPAIYKNVASIWCIVCGIHSIVFSIWNIRSSVKFHSEIKKIINLGVFQKTSWRHLSTSETFYGLTKVKLYNFIWLTELFIFTLRISYNILKAILEWG